MARFGQADMGSTADFLKRSMRGSKVGAEAIAPPSQRLQKAPRKGIGTLPSPKNYDMSLVPPPPPGGNAFLNSLSPQPKPTMALSTPRGKYMVPPPPVASDMSEYPVEEPTGNYNPASFFEPHAMPVPSLSPMNLAPRERELEPQLIDDGSQVHNTPFAGDWIPNVPSEGATYIPPGMIPPEPKPVDQYGQLKELQKLFPIPGEVARPERGTPEYYKPKLTYVEDEKGNAKPVLDATPTPENFNDYRMQQLQNQFRQGMTNKHQFDAMMNQQGNRDARDFQYDDFGANVFNPIAGLFVGKGGRKYLDDKSASMNKNLAVSRQARIGERNAQMSGDKYYNDMLNDLDPNTTENMLKRQNAMSGYNNSITGLNNSLEKGENFLSLADHRDSQDQLGRDKLKQVLQQMGIKEQDFLAALAQKKAELARKEQNDREGTFYQKGLLGQRDRWLDITEDHNHATEANAAQGASLREKGLLDAIDKRNFAQFMAARKKDTNGNYIFDESARAATRLTYRGDNPNHAELARDFMRQAKAMLPGGQKADVVELARKIAKENGMIVEREK